MYLLSPLEVVPLTLFPSQILSPVAELLPSIAARVVAFRYLSPSVKIWMVLTVVDSPEGRAAY